VAPLVQELSHATATVFASRAPWYDGELVSFTGRLASFGPFGAGFVAPLETAAAGPYPGLQLRLPEALWTALDLTANCVVSVGPVPFWFVTTTGTTVLPTAYAPADFGSIACPAPTLAAAAAIAPTQVRLSFDRVLDPATVLADGSQFAVSPALAVTAAAVAGKQVTLTTAPQTAAAGYTVTVANTVHDLYGSGVAPPGIATFAGAP
jgi:hypothetical protein